MRLKTLRITSSNLLSKMTDWTAISKECFLSTSMGQFSKKETQPDRIGVVLSPIGKSIKR